MSAIQIYRYEDKKYCFDLKAFKDIIEKSKDNLVAIYSMAGPLRMGKSFMMGFFVRYMKAKGMGDWIRKPLVNPFTVGTLSVRETTGIWMWSEPFNVVKSDGTTVSVFLLDTQGCFDDRTSMQENACVFALTTLLSSVMIFNIKSQLSEDILQFLQYFAGYARLADESEEEPYQRMVFLIRDWEFTDYDYGLYDDKTSIKGKNFKKDKFDVSDAKHPEVKYIREAILSTFKDISVYLMPHPGKEVTKTCNIDVNKLDKEFVTHLEQFVAMVLKSESIVPKSIGGQYLNGTQLLKFVEKWVEMFKCDAIPQSMTIGQATAHLQHEMAKVAAIDNYNRGMRRCISTNPGLPDDKFQIFNKQLMKASIDLFKNFKRLFKQEMEDKYLESIQKEMERSFEHYFLWNSKDRECDDLKKKMNIKTNRLEIQIEATKKELKNLRDENMDQKEKFEKKLRLGERKLSECNERFTKELTEKESVIENIKKDLRDVRTRVKTYIDDNKFCSIM